MERINGYIDLSKEFIKSKKQHQKNIIQTSRCSTDAYWIKNFNDKNYLFKIITEENQKYRSLLIEEMANLVGIQVPHTEMALMGYYQGELIEDYRKPGYNYIPGSQILYEYYIMYQNTEEFDNRIPQSFKNRNLDEEEITEVLKKLNNLETIWNALNFHYRKNKNREKIVYDITSKLAHRFAFDFLTMQRDRHASNWEIAENNMGEAELTPLYDSNCSFNTFKLEMKVNELSKKSDPYQELNYYLCYSSSEFIDFFNQIYQLFTPEKVGQILEDLKITRQIKIPEKEKKKILSSYLTHYQKMTNLIEERGKRK